MASLVQSLIQNILSGGSQGIIAILMLVIMALLYHIRGLNQHAAHRDTKLEKIADQYLSGYISLKDALESLKFVLIEIKSRLH